MDDDRARDVGLFRYSLIRDPADPALSKAERGVLVRALAAVEHRGADGEMVSVGRSTLDDWIRAYRAGGFDALGPQTETFGGAHARRGLGLGGGRQDRGAEAHRGAGATGHGIAGW